MKTFFEDVLPLTKQTDDVRKTFVFKLENFLEAK